MSSLSLSLLVPKNGFLLSAEFTSNNLDVSAVAPVCRGVSSLGQVSLLERSLRQSEGDLSWVALGQEGRSCVCFPVSPL